MLSLHHNHDIINITNYKIYFQITGITIHMLYMIKGLVSVLYWIICTTAWYTSWKCIHMWCKNVSMCKKALILDIFINQFECDCCDCQCMLECQVWTFRIVATFELPSGVCSIKTDHASSVIFTMQSLPIQIYMLFENVLWFTAAVNAKCVNNSLKVRSTFNTSRTWSGYQTLVWFIICYMAIQNVFELKLFQSQ